MALPDQVTLEPGAATATRVKISGVFSRFGGGSFGAAETGYTYYVCPAGQESQCRREWTEIKAAAGTGSCVGYGGTSASTGTVRPATQAAANPDPWPIEMGTRSVDSTACQKLKTDAVQPKRGCSLALGAPSAVLALAALGFLLRRRRR